MNRQARYRATARGQATARAYALARYAQRHAIVDALKAVPCEDCGGTFPPECMDFDHVRGAKRGEVSDLLLGSLERLLDEIAKCDIICANCHRTRTKARLGA